MKKILDILINAVTKYAYSGKVDPNQPIKWIDLIKALEKERDSISKDDKSLSETLYYEARGK